jgi:hypothetical protein
MGGLMTEQEARERAKRIFETMERMGLSRADMQGVVAAMDELIEWIHGDKSDAEVGPYGPH